MSLSFKHPPLVEIIAELRWQPAQMLDPSGAIPMPVFAQMAAPYEDAFLRFILKVAPLGWDTVERLMPSGMAMLPNQPVMRIKQKIGSPEHTAYQLGPKYFSANGTQGYRTWDEFKPKVRQGVAALLETRPVSDSGTPVIVSLRYIDAFRDDLTKQRPLIEFLSKNLDINVLVPDGILRHCDSGKHIEPALKLTVPLKFGTMTIGIANGTVDRAPAVVMETLVTFEKPTDPDTDTIMGDFSTARGVIHDVFVRLTKNLHALMEPQGTDDVIADS